MFNYIIHNFLRTDEIADILNDPIVIANRDNLLLQSTVDFSIPLSDTIKAKFEFSLSVDLSQITDIPMTWIKGDTHAHNDTGVSDFNNTYLIYLTNSQGNLVVDGQYYSITSGNAHVFSKEFVNSTINTGNDDRLMIGPMSEFGFRVGA